MRKSLHALGFRYRLHRKDLPGKPDIVLPKHKAVVFVHGCFWHSHEGCKRAARPTTNRTFWDRKLDRNAERDRKHHQALMALGWNVLVVWECELARDGGWLERVVAEISIDAATGLSSA